MFLNVVVNSFMTSCRDEELMRLAVNDDVSAFEELFRRHRRPVYDFFCRMVWNAEKAKDCTQETFVKLWRGRAHYTGKGKFSTYLFRIARNHLLDSRRKQKARHGQQRVRMHDLEGSYELSASSRSAYTEAVAGEIQSAISDAVSRLPEMHRLVYVLSEEQRMPYKEIAAVLDCPVGTVCSKKFEAIRKLRKLLRPLRDELVGGGFQSGKRRPVRESKQEEDK